MQWIVGLCETIESQGSKRVRDSFLLVTVSSSSRGSGEKVASNGIYELLGNCRKLGSVRFTWFSVALKTSIPLADSPSFQITRLD